MDHRTLFAEHEDAIRRFESGWTRDAHRDLLAHIPTDAREPSHLLAELVQIDLEFRYRLGERPRIEDYLERYDALRRDDLRRELLAGELALRARVNDLPAVEELARRFPEWSSRAESLLAEFKNLERTRTPVIRPGRRIALGIPEIPDFTIREELGRGGMGVVYRADQVSLNRTVAVKTLAQVPVEKTAARFQREAEAMARLDHPNIVPIYKVGEWHHGPQPIPFLVMKWYAGGSLDTIPHGPGTPPANHARIVEIVARAVHHAHQRGVLHRDLKPSNILVDESGQPAVCDFGLAGWFDPNEPQRLSDSLIGTPAFMAPEQARDPSAITTAADVYGLGAILYFLLTGKPPIDGQTPMAILDRLGTATPERLSKLNPQVARDLETICLKCLETDPNHRYASAEALADDLRRWQQGLSIDARRPGPTERVWRTVRRHPLTSSAALITLASLVFAVVTLAISNERVRQREAQTVALLEREQRSLYLERVGTAGRLYAQNQVLQAWNTLDLCPDRFRGWEWHYLDRLRRTSVPMWQTSGETVVDIAFRSDGAIVYSDITNTIRIARPSEPAVEFLLKGNYLSAHPKKPWIAIGQKNAVTIADSDGRVLRVFQPFEGWFGFDPTGETIAITNRNVVRILDSATGQLRHEFRGHTDQILGGAFSPDGQTLATGSSDRSVRLWNLQTGQPVGERWTRPMPVIRLAFSSDGRTLAESLPTFVRLTDVATGRSVRTPDRIGVRSMIAPGPDGSSMVTTGFNGEVVLRRITTGTDLASYRGHLGSVTVLTSSPDRTQVASGGNDGTVRLWTVTGSPEYRDLLTVGEFAHGLTLSPDGRQFATATRLPGAPFAPTVTIGDAASGAILRTLPGCGDVAYDPTGRRLAYGNAPNGVTIARPDGTVERTIPTEATVTRIRFSASGRYLAIRTLPGFVYVWDLNGNSLALSVTNLGHAVNAIEWSPQVDHLAIGGIWLDPVQPLGVKEVRIWDLATKDRWTSIPVADTPMALAFRPDGEQIAIAGRNRFFSLHRVSTGEKVLEMIGNGIAINALAYHPTGTRLAAAGVDGSVRLWDPDSGRELLTLTGGTNILFALVWDEPGDRLFSLGSTIRCWTRQSD